MVEEEVLVTALGRGAAALIDFSGLTALAGVEPFGNSCRRVHSALLSHTSFQVGLGGRGRLIGAALTAF